MTNNSIPEMLSLRETAKRTGLSYDGIRKMCLQRKIPYIRCGNKFYINMDRFTDYLNEGELA